MGLALDVVCVVNYCDVRNCAMVYVKLNGSDEGHKQSFQFLFLFWILKQVQEIGTTESQDALKEDEGLLDTNASIQQRVVEATISVSSKVAVCFQLKPSKTKRN